MSERDLYELLGVSPEADDREIKSAFRRLARLHHPDRNPEDGGAKDRFIRISEAFEILSDMRLRALYDEFGQDGLQEGFDPIVERQRRRNQARRESSWVDDSPFESVFHDIHEDDPFRESVFDVYPRGDDLHLELEVDLKLAINGGAKSLAHRGDAIAVRIPPHSQDGDVLTVPREGEPSLHFRGEPGDLLLTLRVVTHPSLVREGSDLILTLPVTISEAILGAKIPIETPHGSVTMSLPEGVHSGARLRLRGMGLEQGDARGDFYVVIQIHTPERIDDSIREAARVLARGYVTDLREDLIY